MHTGLWILIITFGISLSYLINEWVSDILSIRKFRSSTGTNTDITREDVFYREQRIESYARIRARIVDDQLTRNLVETTNRLNKAKAEEEEIRREIKALVRDRDMYVINVREYTNTNCKNLPLDERPASMRKNYDQGGPK